MHSKHDIFLKNIDDAHQWVNDLCFYANLDERHRALALLRIVLHELRDHLTPSISTKLSAQFPLIIRGLYFEGWNPDQPSPGERKNYLFIESISEKLKEQIEIDPEKAVKAVFQVLDRHTTLRHSPHLEQFFPPGIFSLWLKATESPKS